MANQLTRAIMKNITNGSYGSYSYKRQSNSNNSINLNDKEQKLLVNLIYNKEETYTKNKVFNSNMQNFLNKKITLEELALKYVKK